jgi:hypothetical protein
MTCIISLTRDRTGGAQSRSQVRELVTISERESRWDQSLGWLPLPDTEPCRLRPRLLHLQKAEVRHVGQSPPHLTSGCRHHWARGRICRVVPMDRRVLPAVAFGRKSRLGVSSEFVGLRPRFSRSSLTVMDVGEKSDRRRRARVQDAAAQPRRRPRAAACS